MDLLLRGKRALVTGSTSGLGAEIARWLAREGARVVVHGRRAAAIEEVVGDIERAAGVAVGVAGDLSVDAEAARVAQNAADAWGGIDILVNNAGAFPPGDWTTAPESLWKDLYNHNVVSMVRLIRGLVPGMRARGWGRIIVIASIAADQPHPNGPHYGATKAATLNLTVSLAKELAGTGVTANSISPGLVRTPASEPWFAAWAQAGEWGTDSREVERRAVEQFYPNPSGRIGRPADIAYAAALLASPLSDFINGANLRVDGGANPTL